MVSIVGFSQHDQESFKEQRFEKTVVAAMLAEQTSETNKECLVIIIQNGSCYIT